MVRRGDTVKLHSKDVDPSVSGAHVRVEFVIGETLIIFSPAINSNRGLMAVPCSQVETPGSQKVKTKGLKKRRRGGRKRKGKGKGVAAQQKSARASGGSAAAAPAPAPATSSNGDDDDDDDIINQSRLQGTHQDSIVKRLKPEDSELPTNQHD